MKLYKEIGPIFLGIALALFLIVLLCLVGSAIYLTVFN